MIDIYISQQNRTRYKKNTYFSLEPSYYTPTQKNKIKIMGWIPLRDRGSEPHSYGREQN